MSSSSIQIPNTSRAQYKKTCTEKSPSSNHHQQQEREITMAHAGAGGSLPVPNVQALAQTCNRSDEQIPERYIRIEASAEVIGDCDISCSIPIIDLNKLLDPYSSKEECAKLGSACQEWGFFQLINHGVPDEVIRNMSNDMTEFFKQPLEAKKAYSMLPDNLEGYGQHFVFSENQKLDWADLFYLVLRPSESRDTRFWPAYPPSFRNSIDGYSSAAAKLVSCLLQFLAMDMGVEPESLLEIFGGQPQSMRMTYYPPCRQADKILSNGKYRSIEHRAVVHPNKARVSAAVFHQPCQNATVGPLPEPVEDGGAHYTMPQY